MSPPAFSGRNESRATVRIPETCGENTKHQQDKPRIRFRFHELQSLSGVRLEVNRTPRSCLGTNRSVNECGGPQLWQSLTEDSDAAGMIVDAPLAWRQHRTLS